MKILAWTVLVFQVLSVFAVPMLYHDYASFCVAFLAQLATVAVVTPLCGRIIGWW